MADDERNREGAKDGYVSTTPENLENLRSNFKMHEKEWMPLKSMQ